jgi:hypothetical protein
MPADHSTVNEVGGVVVGGVGLIGGSVVGGVVFGVVVVVAGGFVVVVDVDVVDGAGDVVVVVTIWRPWDLPGAVCPPI